MKLNELKELQAGITQRECKCVSASGYAIMANGLCRKCSFVNKARFLLPDILATAIAAQERVDFAANYSPLSAKACPLCVYEDGKLIECCAMHKETTRLQELYADACEEVTALRHVVAELEAERRWIPVSERLPEEKQRVLVYRDCRNPQVERQIINWWSGDEKTYSHWMPLPTTPQGEKDE